MGVNNKDIIADYLASGVFLKEMIQTFSNSITNKDIYSIINPNYDTMYNLLQYIDNQPNGIIGYLQYIKWKSE